MRKTAIQIVKRLKDAGHQAVFAGGCVRDALMEMEPKDYDIATSALPNEVEKLFEKTVPVGKSFGVIRVLESGFEFEVATFRTDGNYHDGRRPEGVKFATIKDDAQRRDFTINGMFFDPIEEVVIDFVGGQQDLEGKMIRFIGDPADRIAEDRLRMLRALRFKQRFGFFIDEAAFEAIKDNCEKILDISWERIRDEFTKMLAFDPREVINDLKSSGLLVFILPEVAIMEGVEQPAIYHPEGDVLEHAIRTMEALMDAKLDLKLAGLLHDVGKQPCMEVIGDRTHFHHHAKVGAKMAREILDKFRYTNETIDLVGELIYYHMKPMASKEMRVSRLKKLLGLDFIDDLLELHKADSLGSNGDLTYYEFLKEKLKNFTPEEIKPPAIINGRDLIAMGFEPSPAFGEVLGKIYDMQLEGTLGKEAALTMAKEMMEARCEENR